MGIWSNLPYWLKGGIILLLVMAVLNIPLFVLDSTGLCEESDGQQTSLCNLLVLIGLTPGVLVSIFYQNLSINIVIAVSFAAYFIVGAAVGAFMGVGKGRPLSNPKSMAEIEQRYTKMEG